MKFAHNSKDAITKKLERVIFVEGKDDAYFIDKLLDEIGADNQSVGIVFLEGDGAIEKDLSLLIKSAAYVQRQTTHVAFVLDADTSPQDRLEALEKLFQRKGLPCPGHAETAEYDNGRRLAVYIFPDGESAGELEDLLLADVTDNRHPIVVTALQTVEEQHGPLNKRSKRIARMYISVLPIKPCGVGRAYCEGVFPSNAPLIGKVREFLAGFIS